MAETTKKPTTRKRTTKTTQPKKEVEVQEVETPKVEKPQRQKRVEIDRNELIACRSSVNGRLIYISPRTKEKYTWDNFGDTEYLEMGELMTMKSSHPKFLKDVQLIIDDEDAADYLGMTKIYEEMIHLDELDEFFDKDPDEIAELLPKLPTGMKKAVASRSRALVEEGQLDSLSKIRLIEQELGIDLQLFVPKS